MAMKTVSAAFLIAAAAPASAEKTNPIDKVIQMISDLEKKVIAEGEASQKVYDEYAEWCEETSKNLNYELKTGKGQVEELKATISEQASHIESLTAKVEELASAIATAEKDLKAASEIRNKEAADFAANEKELEEVIETLGRAIGILEKELAKGSASLVQNADSVTKALSSLVQASALSTADGNKLASLLQSSQESEDADEDAGAPAGAVYENQSGGILEVLGDLSEKAQAQLDEARSAEQKALNNFALVKQSLDDQIHYGTQDSDAAKKGIEESKEKKATAEGDLEVTTKDIAADTKGLSDLHHDCMGKATEFETGTQTRGEELKALATAKKIIKEATGGATEQTYGFDQVSLLQVARRAKLTSGADLSNFEAVRYVRDLARKEQSPALAQLAKRMQSAMRLSSGSSDPFAKVKGLINDMLDKLQKEAEQDATQNAFCEKELSESNTKKGELETDIEKLTTKIDQASARSAELKEEVATLQKELKELAESAASWTKFRQEEKAEYEKEKPEIEQGLKGIQTALKVLRDYYAGAGGAGGSAGGIISMLEVCESDFSKGLAEMIAAEETAVAQYEQEMKDNELERVAKEKDVEFKTKEHVGLDKAVTELSSDRTGVQTEMDAVLEYLKTLEGQCVAKPDTYAERKKRREAELAGLKEALEILGNEGAASLLQRSTKRTLRGAKKHF